MGVFAPLSPLAAHGKQWGSGDLDTSLSWCKAYLPAAPTSTDRLASLARGSCATCTPAPCGVARPCRPARAEMVDGECALQGPGHRPWPSACLSTHKFLTLLRQLFPSSLFLRQGCKLTPTWGLESCWQLRRAWCTQETMGAEEKRWEQQRRGPETAAGEENCWEQGVKS